MGIAVGSDHAGLPPSQPRAAHSTPGRLPAARSRMCLDRRHDYRIEGIEGIAELELR